MRVFLGQRSYDDGRPGWKPKMERTWLGGFEHEEFCNAPVRFELLGRFLSKTEPGPIYGKLQVLYVRAGPWAAHPNWLVGRTVLVDGERHVVALGYGGKPAPESKLSLLVPA